MLSITVKPTSHFNEQRALNRKRRYTSSPCVSLMSPRGEIFIQNRINRGQKDKPLQRDFLKRVDVDFIYFNRRLANEGADNFHVFIDLIILKSMNIKAIGHKLKQAKSFRYVGGMIESDGSQRDDIKSRISKGFQTIGKMENFGERKTA